MLGTPKRRDTAGEGRSNNTVQTGERRSIESNGRPQVHRKAKDLTENQNSARRGITDRRAIPKANAVAAQIARHTIPQRHILRVDALPTAGLATRKV